MFHGGGEIGGEGLDLGVGAILVLLAMPGVLASMLMFEKYGSLIRFLRGDGVFDPYVATIPDEYFLIVLSMTVTGAAVLWRWNAIFLDRRDYTNLVALPIRLRTIFFANLSAILVVAALFTIVVNAASLFLFPAAVVGSQQSVSVFVRFAIGHAVAIFLGSMFSFLAIFALAGGLIALLPFRLFRSVSLLVRFVIAMGLLALIASSFAVPTMLDHTLSSARHGIAVLPPVWFLGISQSIWGNGNDPFYASMTTRAFASMAWVLLIGTAAYILSFRRSFLRVPETADSGPLPLATKRFIPQMYLSRVICTSPSQRACYDFIFRTLLRSDGHLQIALAFAALSLVASAASLLSLDNPGMILAGPIPSTEFLAIPFILSYCIIIGIRFAFEIPSALEANWIFRVWLKADDGQARPVARRVLNAATLPWLVPTALVSTGVIFNWAIAIQHAAVLTASNLVLVEVLLINFRSVPFTHPTPIFQSHSGVSLLAYLFGYFIYTGYVPELERWSLISPVRPISFVLLSGIILMSIHFYRKQMLEMDKELTFE